VDRCLYCLVVLVVAVGLVLAERVVRRKIISQVSPNALAAGCWWSAEASRRAVWLPVVCGGRAARLGIPEQPGLKGPEALPAGAEAVYSYTVGCTNAPDFGRRGRIGERTWL